MWLKEYRRWVSLPALSPEFRGPRETRSHTSQNSPRSPQTAVRGEVDLTLFYSEIVERSHSPPPE